MVSHSCNGTSFLRTNHDILFVFFDLPRVSLEIMRLHLKDEMHLYMREIYLIE